MVKSQSSRNTDHPEKALTKSDLAAVQQLMQLSDEDNTNSRSSGHNKNKKFQQDGDEVVNQIEVITWQKIEEIFGKEDIDRPKKWTYRSLADIYLTTKLVNARSYGKKVRATF
ncbi:hypothetical protein DVH24_034096 [Malus domestica]|uniref:Uncharacterized protein n=1 Tax=Malus domestica TaxID=3750 RepID=A0A498KMW6_MALDO|nr:hypothetical protein DVH24_034096 [Malus domestica]